jgi:beta-galactosidase GanA
MASKLTSNTSKKANTSKARPAAPQNQARTEIGVAYYPDYLEPSDNLTLCHDGEIRSLKATDRMDEDFRRMKKRGISIVRSGEFSWSLLEPEPGAYEDALFHEFLEQAHASGLGVILCTPTACPPKWLIDLHPDILPVDRKGHRIQYGSRRTYDIHCAAFYEAAMGITLKMTASLGRHPAVVGWQIDNEFGCHGSAFSYSDAARDDFQRWLRAKYKKIELLNQEWMTRFWSQIYSDFHEIELPRHTWTDSNPHLELDYRRFVTEAYSRFAADQAAIIRRNSPNRPVTHNFMTSFHDLCAWSISEHLDVAGFDHYQMTGNPAPLTSCWHFRHMHALKNRPFWVLEQQPGQVNWMTINKRVPYDWVYLWGMQAALLGAEKVLFFSWFKFSGGPEQYHDGIVGSDVRVAESQQERILTHLRTTLDWYDSWRQQTNAFPDEQNSRGKSRVANHRPPSTTMLRRPFDILVVHNTESTWTHEITSQSTHYSSRSQLDWVAGWASSSGLTLDFINDLTTHDRDLNQYAVIVLPGFAFEPSEQEISALQRFSADGGTIVSLPRTAMKQRNNKMSSFPLGHLLDTGVLLLDSGALDTDESELCSATTAGEEHDFPAYFTGREWAERIGLPDQSQDTVPQTSQWVTLARFADGMYVNSPAVLGRLNTSTTKPSGRLAQIHFATCPSLDSAIWQWLNQTLALHCPLFASDTRTLQIYPVHAASGSKRYALLNFGTTEQTANLTKGSLEKIAVVASFAMENNHPAALSTDAGGRQLQAATGGVCLRPRSVTFVEEF